MCVDAKLRGRKRYPYGYVVETHTQDVTPKERWAYYRLGDIVTTRAGMQFHQKTCEHICECWPESIACAYYEEALRSADSTSVAKRGLNDGKLAILKGLVDRYGGDKPLPNTTVVHLRLGDTMSRDDCWEEPPCTTLGRWIHVYPFNWYDEVVREIRKSAGAGSRIVIVGSTGHRSKHSRTSHVNRSQAYIERMLEYFAERGFQASFRGDHAPDDDFVYLASAHRLVAGGGGFYQFAQQIALKRGGIVLEPRPAGGFDPAFRPAFDPAYTTI